MGNYYKKHFDNVLSRWKLFQQDNLRSGALLQIRSITETAKGAPQVKPLNQWDFSTQLYPFLDACMEQLEYIWERRVEIEDDLIPSLYPRFGIAEHSAYLGGEVRVEETTSYHVPFLHTWEDLDKLHTDPENVWFRRVIDGISYIREKGKGKIAARLRGGACPGDVANAIRGNDLFTDFYEYPDQVRRLFSICAETERWFMDSQLEAYGDFFGGILNGNDEWQPHGSFGHLSEDWSVMCSPQMYAEFGTPYTQQLTKGIDRIMMHTHSIGAHMLPELVKMDNMTDIQIVSDPNRPTSLDIMEQYAQVLQGRRILLGLDSLSEIQARETFLKDKKVLFSICCDTLEEAKRAVEYVQATFPLKI